MRANNPSRGLKLRISNITLHTSDLGRVLIKALSSTLVSSCDHFKGQNRPADDAIRLGERGCFAAIKAGLAYFGAVFFVGFMIGTIRVLAGESDLGNKSDDGGIRTMAAAQNPQRILEASKTGIAWADLKTAHSENFR